MVASSIFVMDLKGKILIFRNYRGDIPTSAADKCVRGPSRCGGCRPRCAARWP